jgi:hypothetical protein
MRAYRETFRRHRILFCLPPLLGALALGFLGFSASAKYQSTASLWIDNGPTAGSSLNSTTGTQPSASEQTLLNELLATQNFDLDVANGSALKAYITAQGGTKQQIEGNLASAVSTGVGSSTPGPQILNLTFTGSTPQISQSALQSLISHLQNAMSYYGQIFGQSAQAFYQKQVTTANKALSEATAAAIAFQRSHPGATSQNNQDYAALQAAVQSANGQLANATSQLNQAQSQAAGNGVSTLVRVVDPPALPANPTSGKKKAAIKLVGGLVGGLIITALIIVAMTPSREDRWDVEITGTEPPNRPALGGPPGDFGGSGGDGVRSHSAYGTGAWALGHRLTVQEVRSSGGNRRQADNLLARLQSAKPSLSQGDADAGVVGGTMSLPSSADVGATNGHAQTNNGHAQTNSGHAEADEGNHSSESGRKHRLLGRGGSS